MPSMRGLAAALAAALAALAAAPACESAPLPSPSPPAPPVPKCPSPADTTGAWSATAGGLRARLLMSVPDKDEYGIRIARTWIELENLDDVANPMAIYWDVDAILRFSLEDAIGKPVETGAMAASIVRPQPFWLLIPDESSIRVGVTTSGYGLMPERGLFIGLPGMGAWQLERGDKRAYRLRGRLTVPEPSGAQDPNLRAWDGTLELPPVEVPASRGARL